jgi:Domain of unknown function (DUF4326)
MTTPRRVRLRRTKGWRKPDGAISVARAHKWGNPFVVGEHGVRTIAAQWCSGCEVLQLCGAAADHKNRALDFRLRRPHVVTRRIWPRVTTTQKLALCKTSRTIRFQERRQ